MSRMLRYGLWLWMSAVIVWSLTGAPVAQGFEGLYGESPQTSRIVYFHVPVAIASFIGFLAAGVWSIRYLISRRPSFDRAAVAAVEVGVIFCVLAIVTGAMWAQVQWGAAWNWDPRQTSIVLALLFYLAYLSLRGAIDDSETRARLSSAYASLGLVVSPMMFFILPRMMGPSLHPKPASAEFDPAIGVTLLAAVIGFTAIFFWCQNLRRRQLALASVALEGRRA
ncbi:MAG: cytochrome c biogenesis protein CcsA [Acidobacteriota bacterium]